MNHDSPSMAVVRPDCPSCDHTMVETMRFNKKLLPVLLAASIVTAGCLSMPEDDPLPVQDPEPTTTNGDPEPDPEPEAPWALPEARLGVNQTFGPSPFNVSFDLNASIDTRGFLQWHLDFGDGNTTNGTQTPISINHTYLEIGNLTATLFVTDGTYVGNASVEIIVVDVHLHRFYFRGDGLLDPPSHFIPNDVGINGSMSLTPGNESRTVQTMGPLHLLSDLEEELDEIDEVMDDWITFTSEPLNRSFTILPGLTNLTNANDDNWTASAHAQVHFCTRGNLNGLFFAWVYEVDEDGNETLVLANEGQEFAGTGEPDGRCAQRNLAFTDTEATGHVFNETSRIRIVLAPDVFFGSIGTQFRFNGPEEPFDSSLNLNGYFL